jgi:hypothetical protein
LAFAEKWLDVPFDPTPVHRKRRGLDRPPLAPKDPARFCGCEIPVTDVVYSLSCARGRALFGGVSAFGHGHELFTGFFARLLHRQNAEAT